MRPPGITGGIRNRRVGQQVLDQSNGFNEAAGYHRRNLA